MDLLELNQFPSVLASATSTLVTSELDDYSVHALLFERNAINNNANISTIRVRLDGKDIVNDLSGTRLAQLNVYDGLPDVANYTALFFGDPTANTQRGKHLGDIDLSVYRKPLEIEVALGAAVAPTLRVLALVDVPKGAMPYGYTPGEQAAFKAMIRTQITEAAAVTKKHYSVSVGSGIGALIRRINLFHTNLTSVELKKQSLVKWDDISAARNNAFQQQFARTPSAGLYVLDRVADGSIGGAEPTTQSDGRPWNLNLALTTSAADTITAFSDVITNHNLI